ncbi:TetR/AcrR family transcriptional regulator [Actinoplanes couchii]|uniref:TetR family transcriptional regulator n=1 Tax=Actinoplanes couchii TaxID=403638 RepID=A0ABQ3XTU7_9ACTN|nr:TetR family transcriptional regulator [Actinoplanes couchii]MDR6317763.1 DNA-binding transcriptional regulator YbjK [Actinoplanes couchii]GID61931.1 TetR family transcriptional regulator [Actinoplanes couchii]
MGGPRRVANDPLRKQRILDATLAVIAEHGVHRTTHRRIADTAGVPLGSLTYHFESLDAILEQAFEALADSMSERYSTALTEAPDQLAACAAVTDLICGDDYVTSREVTILHEMYGYANHNPAVAEACRRWLLRSRDSLAVHFPPRACRAIDALIEGWPMHQAWEREPLERDLVHATIVAIAERIR